LGVREASREEPLWLSLQAVLAIHAQLVEQFGGSHGVINAGAIEAAVDRSRNRFHYATADIAALAVAHLVGLIRSHGFVDGNKRIGVTSMLVFLALKGQALHVPQPELYAVAMDVANGRLGEEQAAAWVRARLP
jgi:death-on-curing protein